jgi:hypothetical protein
MRRRVAQLLCAAMVVAGLFDAAGPRHTHAAGLTPPFTTQGSKILDHNGQPVIFKGVNWEGFNEFWDHHQQMSMTNTDIQQAQLWGVNLVRVQLDEEFWNGSCPVPGYDPPGMSADYRQQVETMVANITAAQMLALIDLHVTNRGPCDGQTAPPPPGAQPAGFAYPLPDLTGARGFWETVTTEFSRPAYRSLVAYELYNEPHPCLPPVESAQSPAGCEPNLAVDGVTVLPVDEGANEVWENGGLLTVAAQHDPAYCNDPSKFKELSFMTPLNPIVNDPTACHYVTYTAAGMLQLYEIVDQAAPGSLIFIDGWGSPSTFDPGDPNPGSDQARYHMFPTSGNAVYVQHIYHRGGTPPLCSEAAQRVQDFDTAPGVADHPVVVTEFGWPLDPTLPNDALYAQGFTQNVVNALHGSVPGREDGWAGFSWMPDNFIALDPPNGKLNMRVQDHVATPWPDASDASATGVAPKGAMSGAYPAPPAGSCT